MKKIIALLVAGVLAVSLCACGGNGAQEETKTPTTQATQTPTTQATQAPTEEPTEAPTTEATEPETTAAEPSDFELAQSCIDKSVAELYALIGEPESSDYAPSCLGDGEDGNLYYDGFIVYTYREGDEETVRYVE